MSELFDAALDALEAGLSVVPPQEDGTKAPALAWKAFQDRLPTEAELQHWYANGTRRHGLGLVCGRVSGHLETFEFEGRAVEAGLWEQFKASVAEAGLLPLLLRIQHGYGERTPSGGIHLLYHCTDGIDGNLKLARRAGPDGKPEVLIETRGEGGYVVVAPSSGPVHPSGRPWELLSGGFATIATITVEERAALFAIARSFDQLPAPEWTPPAAVKESAGGRPGDDFNARADWAADVLQPAGWTRTGSRGGREHWYRGQGGRPGWTSATITEDGRYLYVFSSSTELPTEVGLSKFRTYAFLHHGGDFAAASKELRGRGYGDAGGEIRSSPVSNESPAAALAPDQLTVYVRTASAIKPRRIDFLWKGRIARGKLTAIGGDPGAGKGTLGIDFASRISRGADWPDGLPCPQGRVLLLTPEDDAADTIVPRLIAAGTDLDQVDVDPQIPGTDGKPRRINLESDTRLLMEHARATGVTMVVIDPISSYLGANTNSWRDADMRRILDPLAEEAARHGIAIVTVAHLTKDSNRRAMYRFQGSIATVASARFAFVVAANPKEPERRVMACIKTNLGAMPMSLTFRIASTRVEEIDEEVGRIEWTGATSVSADELLGPQKASEAADRAKEFLLDYLSDGPCWSEAVKAAAKAKGIGRDSLWAAKDELRINAIKLGLDGWKWALPDQDGSTRITPPVQLDEGISNRTDEDQDASVRFSSEEGLLPVITANPPPLQAREAESLKRTEDPASPPRMLARKCPRCGREDYEILDAGTNTFRCLASVCGYVGDFRTARP